MILFVRLRGISRSGYDELERASVGLENEMGGKKEMGGITCVFSGLLRAATRREKHTMVSLVFACPQCAMATLTDGRPDQRPESARVRAWPWRRRRHVFFPPLSPPTMYALDCQRAVCPCACPQVSTIHAH